jgi:hypothetical protein
MPSSSVGNTVGTDGAPGSARRSRGVRRVGYALAAGVNLAAWWIARNLLGWEWPSFLTPAFEDLSGLVGFLLAATAVMNLIWMAYDPPQFQAQRPGRAESRQSGGGHPYMAGVPIRLLDVFVRLGFCGSLGDRRECPWPNSRIGQ